MSAPSENKRVTLADVGKACGYHGTTVGLALKNHPRIPEKTREKIQEAARKLGYHPDPVLSSLIAYRRQKVDYKFNSKIAIVSDMPAPNSFASDAGYGQMVYRGIVERAAELGYETEFFAVGLSREGEKQVDRVLKARGISAIIVYGLERPGIPIHLDWDNYSVISIGYSHPNPRISRVTTKNRWASIKCVEEALAHGYQRPVLVIPKDYDNRVDKGWSAGFLSACYEQGLPAISRIFLPEDRADSDGDRLFDFLEKTKADSIITSGPHVMPILRDNGYRIPEEFGFLCLDVREDDSVLSGVCQNASEVGRQATTLVSNLQINNVRGLASHEYIHLVAGTWMPGTTIARH